MLIFELVLLYLVIGFLYTRAMGRLGDPNNKDAPLPDFFYVSRLNIDKDDNFDGKILTGFTMIMWPAALTIDLLLLLFYVPGKIIHNR